MTLFDKPDFLKPEINETMYYVHIVILVIVILFILKQFFGHDMLTIDWTWKLSIAAIAGDIVAHTLLGID